jgi:hypothetical protein
MDLSRRIDKCPDDVVYFTEESGSWQIGAAWSVALPVYFRCLIRTATQREYRNAVERAIADFGSYSCVPRAQLQLTADETWQSRKSP